MQARSLVQKRKPVESEMPPLSPKKEAKIPVSYTHLPSPRD